MSPRDGKTFYAASTGGQTFVAIDLTDPTAPRRLFQQRGVNYHGLRLSADGRTLYAANIGNDLSRRTLPGEGLRHPRRQQDPGPQGRTRRSSVLSDLTWSEGSIPQVAEPFTQDGTAVPPRGGRVRPLRPRTAVPRTRPCAQVGAGRIIDVDDPRHPMVVSDLRLEVHQPAERIAARNDPGASSPVRGYTAHYCSVPQPQEPEARRPAR